MYKYYIFREFSSEPHLAGSDRDHELVKLMETTWKDNGLDHVELVPYHVLLTEPDPCKPNKVTDALKLNHKIMENYLKCFERKETLINLCDFIESEKGNPHW